MSIVGDRQCRPQIFYLLEELGLGTVQVFYETRTQIDWLNGHSSVCEGTNDSYLDDLSILNLANEYQSFSENLFVTTIAKHLKFSCFVGCG